MSRRSRPVSGSRRRFLNLALPAAAALATPGALAGALAAGAAADESAAKKPRARAAGPAESPADPFAAARPDLSVARTPEERATLERQWKGMVEAVAAMRAVPVDESTPPAVSFAALRRHPAPARGRRREGR